jgi:hypothetical protein
MKIMTSVETGSGQLRYHYSESLAATTSEAVILPGNGALATVLVVPGATSTGSVEITISTPAQVKAQTAVWTAWADGAVSAATLKTLTVQATALRLVVTGTCDWEVLA